MFKQAKSTYYAMGAAMTVGVLAGSAHDAHAANNFGSIASNLNTSISSLPGLVAAFLGDGSFQTDGVRRVSARPANRIGFAVKDGKD